ncbi:uncharacterized protein LODBEIA_P26080 [Lodderomyces beijingensis]|uniref:Protein-tyrosine-phosphatase n=1 Tax=Lodderomyces beijingensis TaxID=1775926 RepID=A0ABP0ZJQ4_9ASCO
MSSSDDEVQELLAVTASSGSSREASGVTASCEKLNRLVASQQAKTRTTWGRLLEFVKIGVFGYPNQLERYIVQNEANDCSLIAKYATVTDIDLSQQSGLSVDSVTLSTLRIPHPLTNFMRNEANQQLAPELQEHIDKELSESPVVVFIHGMGGQMSQFEPLMGLLSQCCEVISLDLPGFGNSKVKFLENHKFLTPISKEEQERIATSIAKMAWQDFQTDNIVCIIKAFLTQELPQHKKLILIGHSMGTHICVKLAKSLPKSSVEGMILLTPPTIVDDVHVDKTSSSTPKSHSLFKIFTYFPTAFDYFRIWDRLPGLSSVSVARQLSNTSANSYNSLRQFRWNLDVNSSIVLKYGYGFKRATTSELLAALSRFNDNPSDQRVYEKTLFVGGSNDLMTPVKAIYDADKFLSETFGRKVSACIEVKDVGHSLLLAKPEFISGMVLNHIEQKFPERLHLSPAWVLKVKALISGDKWGLKNELKWSNLKPISSNITRRDDRDDPEVAPILGMKTLREGDKFHSPAIVEKRFYHTSTTATTTDNDVKGNLIAIIDISADIPPYSPKAFERIQYYKCATVSKVVPDQSSIRRFLQLIDDILQNNDVEDPLIGVHCHYGFNRTGFLICCYLIEKLGWSVQEAVDGFKRAKPPGIKHPHFIDALYVRYDS